MKTTRQHTPRPSVRRSFAAINYCSPLSFSEITLDDIPAIARCLSHNRWRTCDFSIGGILMWTDFFRYKYCTYRDTLFISGVSEADEITPSFSLPIGELPLSESLDLLREYCEERGIALRLSAVPEPIAADLAADDAWVVTELADWSDYLYNIEDLATLRGKPFNKKRNHVNRFIADNPGYELVEITSENVGAVIDAYRAIEAAAGDDEEDTLYDFSGFEDYEATKVEEQAMTVAVLSDFNRYPFEGVYLTDRTGRIVAFSVAEIIGDTAYVHIEKMDKNVAGAGAAINKFFAERIARVHPEVKYLNREEDCGDPALRYAKQSYRPTSLLRKYDLQSK